MLERREHFLWQERQSRRISKNLAADAKALAAIFRWQVKNDIGYMRK